MSEAPIIKWPGQSGKEYEYSIHPIETSFPKKPGNYVFAKKTEANKWSPCYIGQTKNLDERLDDHEKEECAIRNGATHIHAHLSSEDERVRKAEEADLIRRWQPPCNDQLVG